MRVWLFVRAFCVSLPLAVAAGGQSASHLPPVPADTYELVSGPVQVINTPESRSTIFSLMERARQSAILRTPGSPPFALRISFHSSGSSSSTASGEMEETWISADKWRWFARLGDYTLLRISAEARLFDEISPAPVPLRLQMARAQTYGPIPAAPRASIRAASAVWNGREVTCVMIGGTITEPTSAPGRRWTESEYCIDRQSGLLVIDSPAPGVYSVYDYNGALKFHAWTLPRQISVFEGNNAVLQIHFESIQDATDSDPGLFTPSEAMRSQEPGPLLAWGLRFPLYGGLAPAAYAGANPQVMVNAILDGDGKVLEAEALPNPDPDLSKTALDLVKQTNYGPAQARGRIQRQAYIRVYFGPEP